MDSEVGIVLRDYPAIRGWIDEHYDVAQQSAFSAKPLTVLVDKSLPRERNASADGSTLFQVTISSTMPQR